MAITKSGNADKRFSGHRELQESINEDNWHLLKCLCRNIINTPILIYLVWLFQKDDPLKFLNFDTTDIFSENNLIKVGLHLILVPSIISIVRYLFFGVKMFGEYVSWKELLEYDGIFTKLGMRIGIPLYNSWGLPVICLSIYLWLF